MPLRGRPGDLVWHFAFGSNLHRGTFEERRGIAPRERRIGRLPGYRLRFNLAGRPRGKAAAVPEHWVRYPESLPHAE